MTRLAGIETFVMVVEAGSFSAAARRLGLSKAAVSDQIARLEARLAARLLQRTTRRLTLTEAGQAFLESAQRILLEADRAEATIGALQSKPHGMLRVSAPMTFGSMHLAPIAARFLAVHPEMQLDLVLNDRYVDLLDERFDLAIRIGQPEDSSLVGRHLSEARRYLVAAPAYLAAHGTPRRLADIAHHECLAYSYERSGDAWRYRTADGGFRLVPLGRRLRANNGQIILAGAIAGLGLATLPGFIVATAIRDGGLVRIDLEDGGPTHIAVTAMFPHRQLSAKVRAFVDFMVQTVTPRAPWELEE